MEKQVIDQKTVKQLEHLLGDNFHVLVATFEEDAIAKVSSVRHNYEKNHLAELSRVIHSLKGASLNMGAQEMASLCQRIETDIKNNQTADLDKIIVQLEASLIDVKVVLGQLKTS